MYPCSKVIGIFVMSKLSEFIMQCTYANIVNIENDDTVVNSFITNPIFRFIKFYKEYDDPSLDKSLPTLYVGYREVKQRFEINILEGKINDLSWWCPSPEEDAMRFLKGFQTFLSEIPSALVQNIRTIRTDPVFGPAKNGRELLDMLNEYGMLVTYLRQGAYSIYTKTGEVLIVDEVLYGAYGIKTDKLKAYLAENSNHFHDDENDSVYHFFTNRFEYSSTEVCKYIPYLIWIKAKTGVVNSKPTQEAFENEQTVKN